MVVAGWRMTADTASSPHPSPYADRLIRYSAIFRAMVLRCRPSISAAIAEIALGALEGARDEHLLELAPGVVVEHALVEHFRHELLQLIAHGL